MAFDYAQFKAEIFSQLTSQEKSSLFYWSLSDPSCWEEVRREYFPDFECGKLKAMSILNKYGREFRARFIDPDPEDFYIQFVQSEFLTNFMLAAELEDQLRVRYGAELDVANLVQTEFPDNIFAIGERRYHLEVKGVLSGRNLKHRVVDEVVASVSADQDRFERFLLLILFPFCPNEERGRVVDFVGGYYGYEDIEGFKGPHRRVLCQCFSERHDPEYSLEKLAERIIAYFDGHQNGEAQPL